MQVAVTKTGTWMQSKHGDGLNKQIVFQVLDEEQAKKSKYVKLNVTDYETERASGKSMKEKWEESCQVGNVLDVQLLNDANVNKFGPFTVIRTV